MKRVRLPLAVAVLGTLFAASVAIGGTCLIGGHDETSENFASASWVTTAVTPGSVPSAVTGTHLVISEVAVRGVSTTTGSDSSEFVEIYNPTSVPVSLDGKYLSDDIGYYKVVNGPFAVANASDFCLAFPAGIVLSPGRTIVLCDSKAGFAASGGTVAAQAQYFLEMHDSNQNTTDDMINVATGSSFPLSGGEFTNPSATSGEWCVLFCWDGASDLVCDIDYASWGANSASNPKMTKTGVSIDGPDAGTATSAYNADTAPASQSNLGSGTTPAKPNSYQRISPESGETQTGGNGCIGKLGVSNVSWTPIVASQPTIRFHAKFTNLDDAAMSPAATGHMSSQEFGVFLPDAGTIGDFQVPPLQPNSFFDVFLDVPLAQLPQQPEKRIGGPGGALKATMPAAYGAPNRTATTCPPDTNWAGNVDIQWTATGQSGQVNKHYGDLLTCAGGAPSFIHFRPSNCTLAMPWVIGGVCPGFSVTLVNEDFSPAPNPTPPGWSGWIEVQAAAAAVGTNCCFSITFQCANATSAIDICSFACQCQQTPPPQPQPGTIDWTNVPGTDHVRFHVRWSNPSATDTSAPVSGQMNSQAFGVFQPDYGPIGPFNVPPIAPNSFFDVFTELPLSQLPPSAPITGGPANLMAGGPGRAAPLSIASACPPDTTWAGNVDIQWTASGAPAQVNYHFGALQVCPGSGATYIHVRPITCPSGAPAPWSIAGLCPGFSATLVNEDYTPAPNPVPPGWSGFICVSAVSGTPVPTTCCFTVKFVCDGTPAYIQVCATTCQCQTAPNPVPGTIEWTTLPGTTTVQFHVQWSNPSTVSSAPITGTMSPQEFGLGLPNLGTLGSFTVPPMQPNSFFDVFIDVPLAQLPPTAPTQGEPATGPCVPGTHWDGNVDIIWNGPAGPGEAHKHIGDLTVCAPGGASMIHVKGLLCPSGTPMPWSLSGGCTGVNLTLLNEDLSPAPNPVPPGWTGWIQISATAAAVAPSTCCFKLTFLCDNVPGVLDLCANICRCQGQPDPVLTTVDWTTVGPNVHFHFQWTNPTNTPSAPIDGGVNSQPFGVFMPDAGTLGPFNVPPLQPNSFFDVFFDVPLAQLPPSAPKQLVGGGPGASSNCPQDNHWDGNVDVHWTGQGGTAQANYHFGTILLNTGGGNSFIHVISGCTDPGGSAWTLANPCPGFTVKLLNEDHSTAPATLPPNWTGWLQLSAAGAAPGQTCCVDLRLTCGTQSAVIRVCATTCYWGTLGVGEGAVDFAIRSIVPNPSSGATSIGFSLAKADHAKVEVFDAAGHRVRTVVDGAFGAGSHTALWDGRTSGGDLAQPGTYFIRLSAGTRTASHKLVLQR